MKKIIVLSFALFLGLTGCASVVEKNGQNQTSVSSQAQLVERFTDDELVGILKEAGYRSVETPREGRVYLRIDNNMYVIFNEKNSIQLWYYVIGADINFEQINRWNLTRRYTKAYLDSDMDPNLEADLQGHAGYTKEQVLEFVDTFILSAGMFRRFIIEQHHAHSN